MTAPLAVAKKSLDEIREFRSDGFVRKRVWETEALHCNIYCFEPGQQNSLHHHPVSNEVIFCWEGEGAVVVDGKHVAIRAGETVLVPVAAPHGYINTSKDRRMVITVVQCPTPVVHVPDNPGDIGAIIQGPRAGPS